MKEHNILHETAKYATSPIDKWHDAGSQQAIPQTIQTALMFANPHQYLKRQQHLDA